MREAKIEDVANRKPNGQFGKGNRVGTLHIGHTPTNGFQVGNTFGKVNKGRTSWIKGRDIRNDPKYAGYRLKMSIAAQARAKRERRQNEEAITPRPNNLHLYPSIMDRIKGIFGITD